MMPYCELHGSFKYHACKTCSDAVCPYCKQKDHKNHSTVILNEFGNTYRNHVSTTLKTCQIFYNNFEKLVYPDDHLDNAIHLITERATEMRTKCLHAVESIEKQMKEKLTHMQTDGNIITQHIKWSTQLNAYKNALNTAESLQGKGNVEIIWNSPSVLEMLSRIFPNVQDNVDYKINMREGGENNEHDLFKVVADGFGIIDIPFLDDNSNINLISVNPPQNEC